MKSEVGYLFSRLWKGRGRGERGRRGMRRESERERKTKWGEEKLPFQERDKKKECRASQKGEWVGFLLKEQDKPLH